MRSGTTAIATLGLLLASAPASAYIIVPASDESGRIFVIVERDYGDAVPLSALPPPFDQIVQTLQGPSGLTFRWRYFRSDEDGMFYIRVDEEGIGSATFGFNDPEPVEGDRLGAAAVLVDRNGRAMHSVVVRANVDADADGSLRSAYRAEVTIERAPGWWREVETIALLNMKYYVQQAPSDQGVWQAMTRAVERFTGGAGTSQRAVAE